MSTSDDSAWWMFSYKVEPCPIQERHDWSNCPNAHRGERAARRCPRSYSYTPEPCPQYSKTGACAQGVSCPMAHSVFESWLHPSRFRTQLCCFGTSCKRRICFFAHEPSQLRAATETPNSAAAAAAAAAAGAPVLRRTQAVVPASMMATMYPVGASSSSGAKPQQGTASAVAASSAVLQQQQPQLQLQQGQHLAEASTVAPWVYTSAGWVQAPPAAVGAPVLVPVANMQAYPQLQQQLMSPLPGALMPDGMQPTPAGLMPLDPAAVLPGLAGGLSGLSLQDQPDLSSSSQSLACMPPAILPTSPNATLLYHQQVSAAYGMPPSSAGGVLPAVQPAAAVIYAPAPGSATRPGVQQQQLMVAGGAALSLGIPGQPPMDAHSQRRWP